MSNSPLVDYVKISPNKSSPRRNKIDTITIHCVVGQCTVETLGNVFYPTSRQASSNYGIGYDGRIGMYVEEKDRSWCSSSGLNDNRAITIEVASNNFHPYAVTVKAYSALIELCADICKRNGIKQLLWRGDKSLIGQVDKQNMTVHRWFANKSCPGDYLYERHGDIAERVNIILNSTKPPIIKPPIVVQPPIVKPLPNTLPNLANGKRTFTYKDLNFYEFPVSKLQLEYWDRPKNSANFPVFCNAGFFAYYKEKVSGIDKYFTLPVGNLCCHATYLTPLGRKYLEEWTGKKITNQVKINANQNPRNTFKNVSTLVISNNNTAKIIDSNTLPEDCKFAISGVPTIRNGDDVSWGSYVKPQGWESGMYATYRNWIAITKTGSMLLISGKTGTNNYIYGMEFWNKVKDLNLIQDCVALDGGGSYVYKNQSKITRTTENRQINSILIVK